MRRLVCLLGLGLLLCARAALPAADGDSLDQVRGLLERMVKALRTLNYSGTLVYLHGNQLESLQLTHVVRDGKELERLISLNGSAREVQRDASSVICVMPESKAVSVDRRAPGAGLIPDFGDLGLMERHYNLFPLGDYRVAGRSTIVLGVIPKDSLRYGYRFYLDDETGLPLKTDLMDTKARPVEQIMFTSLDLNPPETLVDADDGALQGFARIETDGEQQIDKDRLPGWQFGDLPSGFRLQTHNLRADHNGRQLEHLVVSDGLASVSVYIENGEEDGLQGAANVGAVHAWGDKVADFWVTAVGEVPSATVRQIVHAMNHRDGHRQ
jgi:sigma-E factor negative regulatory protein RseB